MGIGVGESVYNSQPKAKVVMLWEHFLLLCDGDYIKALLMDRLIFYSRQHESLYALLKEEQGAGNLPTFSKEVDLDKLSGWIRRSAQYLADSLLIGETARTVSRKLEELEQDGLLFVLREKGKSNAYRPNLRVIEERLKDLGFRIDGSRTGDIQVDYAPPDPLETAPVVDVEDPPVVQQAWWEADIEPDPEWLEWANKQARLANAPDYIRKASYLMFKETGFEPFDRSWVPSVTKLWEECGSDEEAFVAVLREGQRLREQKKFILSGPKSFMGFARNASSLKRTLDNVVRVESVSTNDDVIRV